MIAITVRIFWGFGKLALLLRSIYLEHLEGGWARGAASGHPPSPPKNRIFSKHHPPHHSQPRHMRGKRVG